MRSIEADEDGRRGGLRRWKGGGRRSKVEARCDVRADARYFFLPAPFFAARLRLAVDRRLFTVAAAMRFAVFALRPRPFADFLIFSYIRLFFAPFTPRGGIGVSSNPGWRAKAVLARVGLS